VIELRVSDGETVNTVDDVQTYAKPGALIAKGPLGDEWPIQAEIFYHTYEPTDEQAREWFLNHRLNHAIAKDPDTFGEEG
jgi:hypothetical protein